MNVRSIPKATLGRLPAYIEYLKGLPEEKYDNISATKIANALSFGEVQVRKDLAIASGAGKPKIGYERISLIRDLESHLGCECMTNAVLVGTGKLGRALLDYGGFEELGISIVAGFDCNEKLLRTENEIKPIIHIKDIESFCAKHNIGLGIITVGKESAQYVCDKLVSCGIKAIWNFAPCSLSVSGDILIKQENLALSLAHLNSQLKTRRSSRTHI